MTFTFFHATFLSLLFCWYFTFSLSYIYFVCMNFVFSALFSTFLSFTSNFYSMIFTLFPFLYIYFSLHYAPFAILTVLCACLKAAVVVSKGTHPVKYFGSNKYFSSLLNFLKIVRLSQRLGESGHLQRLTCYHI